MLKSQWLSYIFPLLLLPITASSQSKNSPEQLQAMLQQTGQDSNRVKLLLELGSYHLFKPEEIKTDLDSALFFFLAATDLSKRLKNEKWTKKSLWMLSRCYFERGEVPPGREAFMQAMRIIQNEGNKAAEADAWMTMGSQMVRNANTCDEAIHYYQQAISLYQRLGDEESKISTMKEIADVHLIQGKLDESENNLLEVIERYKDIGFRKLHYTYDLLTAVNTVKGNLDRALFFGLETIKSMEATGDSAAAATFYYRLGRIYGQIGDIEKSVEWYKKAYERGVDFNKHAFATLVVQGMIQLGKPEEALAFLKDAVQKHPPITPFDKFSVSNGMASCYDALQQYDLAEKYYLEIAQFDAIAKNQDANVSSSINFAVGKFYVKRHRYQTAEPYLNKILAFRKGIVTTQQLGDTHLLLFKIDSAAGDYLSAIQHFRLHKQLNDSIFSEAKSRQIEELQIQYATEKKEQDFKLQENKLQQANLAKNITFGTGTLLLVILGLLYNRYRLKQRANRQLEVQQREINQTNRALQNLLEEKERLLREIHHRVKNNLQIVMSLLNSQSAYLENDKALTAIRDSQQRIHSISLIHQKLYQSENVAMINMSDYIRELVEYLQGSFDTRQNIRFSLQTEPIELDVTQAVPVGLILNEAISNAVKYAFPNGETGTVTISMHQTDDDHFTLKVTDNGKGLPEGFDPDKSNSLGMSLMRGLSKQLNGNFELKNDDGLTVVMTFEKEHIAEEQTAAAELVA